MAYYKLVSQPRHDSKVDEVIFESDGEKKSVSNFAPSELTDDDVSILRASGYEVAEVEAPEEGDGQSVGSDVVGMSPVVGETSGSRSGSEVSQSGMAGLQAEKPPAPAPTPPAPGSGTSTTS